MRLLVLGGTVFLSRAVAADAAARGHDVTAACRGASGALPDGVRHLPLDRAAATPDQVHQVLGGSAGRAGPFDAVVDVARTPAWVRASTSATAAAHHVLVSTISVHPDTATPGGSPATLPTHPPHHGGADLSAQPELYGPVKVACEEVVRAVAASATVVRPGLVVGPGDPTGRFTYWPERLAAVGTDDRVLAPGDPDDLVQVVDVRDLAAWLVDLAERRTVGVLDAVGPVVRRAELLDAVAAGVGARPRWEWVGQEDLVAHDVAPWAGPRSVPLWLPQPEYAGMLAHDADLPRAAGLRTRPVEETAADTLAWVRAERAAGRAPVVTGLTRDEEVAVLDSLGRTAGAH